MPHNAVIAPLAVLLLLLVLLSNMAESACPVTTNPKLVELLDSDLRNVGKRAQIQFIGVVVDVTPSTSSVAVDVSKGIAATPATTGDADSGIAGRENPQGFFYRFNPRLHGMIRLATVVQLTGSGPSVYNFSMSWTLDTIVDYDIARDEQIQLHLNPGFFGPEATTGCADAIYVGTVYIRSTTSSSSDPYLAFTMVTTLVSMILTAIGWRHPGKAIDAQTLVAMSYTSCAEPHARALVGAPRLLAPFALSEDLSGMLLGNCIVVVAVWAIGFLLMVVIGKRRGATTMEEAGSYVFFPRVPFLFTMALYQGTVFCAVRLVAVGVVDSDVGQLVGGLVAAIVLILVVPLATYVYVLRGVLGEFHCYKLDNVNRLWKLFVPSGVWLPKSVRHAAGGVVGHLGREERIFALLVFLSPAATAVILAPQPDTNRGCMAQYVVFLTVQMVLVVLTTWFAPWRAGSDNVLAVASHAVLSCAGAIYAASVDEDVTVYGLEIPQCILLSLCWLRIVNDGLTTLMDHSGLDLGGRLFFWHDGTRGGLDNLYEIKEESREFPDSMLLQDDTDAQPVPSPLASLPSMVKPAAAPDNTLRDLLMKSPLPPGKKEPSGDFSDPFDDDPFAENVSLGRKPSSLHKSPQSGPQKPPSFRKEKSPQPLESDEDPFADDIPKKSPPQAAPPAAEEKKPDAKMRGIARKLMLAARFKKGVEESAEKRTQNEMFGDDFDDDPLRPKKLEKTKTMGDVNDILEQMGTGAAARANPMAEMGGASAFADNQATTTGRKVRGNDLAANITIGAREAEAAVVEDSVKVYRVEFSTTHKRMSLVEQDEKEFGSFFDGDSYVVLNTRVPKPSGPKSLFRELFIWVGQVSTPDEIKAAVSEAASLDNSFPSSYHKAVAHGGHKITRVLQNAETTSFTCLFPGQTIKVIEGGVDADGGQQGRLYHVHGEGAKKMSLTLVPPTVDSLDDGDVFVFDCNREVYIFQGSECSPFEREHGRQYGEKLRSSRAQCVVSVVTQETATDKFWKALGTTKKIGQGMTLRRVDSFLPSQLNRLWVVKGPNDFKMEASGDDVCMTALIASAVLIVDCCSVVYVWVGSKCSPYQQCRDDALQRGVEYLKKHSDAKIPLIRVLEGHEGETFHDLVPEDPIDL